MAPQGSDPIRTAALLAVAAGTGTVAPVAEALARFGVDAAAITAAELAGLLRITAGRIHVGRAAVALYDSADGAERRAVHGTLAAVFSEDPDQRAWHAAAATELPDAALAQALEGAAGRARDQARASQLLERAAHLSPGSPDRPRRLLEAARMAHDAGAARRAEDLLDAALASGPDLLLRARIQHERGRLRLHGETEGLHEFLVAEAALVAGEDRGLASRMLADGAFAAATSDLELARTTVARAAALARGIPESEPFVEAARVSILARSGTVANIQPILDTLLARPREDRGDVDEAVFRLATVPLWREDYRGARRVLVTLVESTRAAGSRTILPVALDTLATIDIRTGHWTRAYRTSSAALRLAAELGQMWQAASCLTTLASIEAARGSEDSCRRHVAEALELGPEDLLLRAYALQAEALLDLGRNAFDDASRVLERLDALLQESGLVAPSVIACLPDLVESHARAGRRDDAAAALRRLEERAGPDASSTTIAAIARCAGLLAETPAFASHFEEALLAHERAETPFERARTELCYGERLRRARRRSDARLQLERAAVVFERLGATPWAARARRELGRDGPARSGVDSALTAHERQVVTLVVAGATNAEAARALYVSPKTVEHHLGHVYRKLALRSRTQLVRRWLDADGRL